MDTLSIHLSMQQIAPHSHSMGSELDGVVTNMLVKGITVKDFFFERNGRSSTLQLKRESKQVFCTKHSNTGP